MRAKALLTTLAVLLLLPTAVAAEELFNFSYFDVTYLDNGMDGAVTAVEGRDTIAVDVGEGDGLALHMSLALNNNIHVFAGYSGSNMDLRATQTVPYPTLDEMRDAFFSRGATPIWDERCDLTGDGMINYEDLYELHHATGDSRVAAEAAVAGALTAYRFGIGYNKMLKPKVGAYAQLFMDVVDLDHGKAAFVGGDRDFGANGNGIGAIVGLQGRVTDRFELEGRVTYSPVGDINMLGTTDADMLQGRTMLGIGGEFWFTRNSSIFAEVEGDGDLRTWAIGARTTFGS